MPEDAASDERCEGMRRRWGCGGRRGERGPAERAAAESFAKTLGLDPADVVGCPFEGVYHHGVTGGHLAELLDARLLVADERVAWEDALGRALTAADVDALAAFKRAKARLDAVAQRERERERAEAEAEAKRRRRGGRG